MLTCGGVFDGAGLLAAGLHQAGIEHRWLCEVDPWRRERLADRFPAARVHDDVRSLGGDAGYVDLVAGGFPCKGASTAGKREGFGHPETVLWREMRRVIREVGPRYVLVENVANILGLHDGDVWGEVLGDLAALGFDLVWDCVPAAAVGATHLRDRVFAVATYADESPADAYATAGGSRPAIGERTSAAADAECERGERRRAPGDVARPGGEVEGEARERQRGWDASVDSDATSADAMRQRLEGRRVRRATADRAIPVDWGKYEPAIRRWEAIAGAAPEPLIRRVDDGDAGLRRVRSRVDRSRLSALGDGVQVQVAYLAGLHILELERTRSAA